MATPTGTHELDARLLRLRTRPGSEDASRLASDLLAADRAQDAIEVTTAGLRSSPDDLALLVLEGRSHYAAGDLLRAQSALLKAARIAPAQKDPFRWLGEVLLKRGDPQRALKVLERARAIDTDDRVIQALHGRAERLSRIAESDGGAASDASRASFERSTATEPEERTVLRPEIALQLAGTRREETAFDDELTSPELDEEEDEPTAIVSRDVFASALAPRQPAPAAMPPRAAAAPPAAAPPAAAAPRTVSVAPSARAPAPVSPRFPDVPPGAMSPGVTSPLEPARSPAAAIGAPGRGEGPRPPVSRKATLQMGALRPASRPPPAKPPAPLAPPLAPPVARPIAAPPIAAAPPAALPIAAPSPAAPSPAAPPPARPVAVESPFAAIDRRPDPFAAIDRPDPFAEPPARRAPPAPEPSAPASEPVGTIETRDPRAPEDAEIVFEDSVAGEPAPDLETGEHAGQPEDVESILGMLREQGIFEPPTGEAAAWAPRKESKVERTRIGVWIGGAWVIAVGLGTAGWFGWQEFVRQRHAQAHDLVEQARGEALIGDHQHLVDAERHLRAARELDPHEPTNSAVLLFVHSQRALEDGAFEVGYLRPTIARAERSHADPAVLHAARSVLAAGESDLDAARNEVQHALEGDGATQAGVLYVVGRIEQRIGDEHAIEHLQAALERDPQLSAAAIALAEARHDEGRPEEAITLLDQVLARHAQNLRAQLWKALLTADDQEPAAALVALDTIHERLEHGAPTDHVLYHLTRARLLRRQGQHEPAGEAIEAALAAGAQEPRLLALMARAARNAGRLLQAEYAATAAVRGSPSSIDFRKLLAGIYLDRRNGRAALQTLAQLSASDPDVLVMTGRAALLVDTDEAIAGASAALDAYVQEHEEDAGVEVRALRIRIGLQVGDAAPLLEAARALARDNPGDPVASLALGEAALRAFDATTATRALEQVTTASPDDADGHWMLARARRMQGDADGSRRSFERAIELRPEHADAKVGLGGLLLDMGQFEAADTLYGEIARMAGAASGMTLAVAGRLGRVEALVGLGRVDDAQVQLEGVRDDARQSASARIAAAHLALARGRAGDAIREVRPLVPDAVEGTAPPAPSVLAIYGDALLGAGEVEPAAETYERALAGDAGLPEALIGRAELFVRADHERDAAPLLVRARASLETRIRPPALRARLLMLEGRVALMGRDEDTARAKLRESTAIAGAPAEAWFHLGEALSGDNAPEARSAYLRYLELAPEGSFASRARRATAGR